MARKNKPESAQMGLGLPGPSLPTSVGIGHALDLVAEEPRTIVESAGLDLESFDDYDETKPVDSVPLIRLVDPPLPFPRVIVECVGDIFEVSRLRDDGTTVACVMWTREELQELQRRISAALEM